MVYDFTFLEGEKSFHLLNLVSPGWTSAISIADYVVDKYLKIWLKIRNYKFHKYIIYPATASTIMMNIRNVTIIDTLIHLDLSYSLFSIIKLSNSFLWFSTSYNNNNLLRSSAS